MDHPLGFNKDILFYLENMDNRQTEFITLIEVDLNLEIKISEIAKKQQIKKVHFFQEIKSRECGRTKEWNPKKEYLYLMILEVYGLTN